MNAAKVLAQSPQATQLRYLKTVTNIASDKSSTIAFLMPVDSIETNIKLTAERRSG